MTTETIGQRVRLGRVQLAEDRGKAPVAKSELDRRGTTWFAVPSSCPNKMHGGAMRVRTTRGQKPSHESVLKIVGGRVRCKTAGHGEWFLDWSSALSLATGELVA